MQGAGSIGTSSWSRIHVDRNAIFHDLPAAPRTHYKKSDCVTADNEAVGAGIANADESVDVTAPLEPALRHHRIRTGLHIPNGTPFAMPAELHCIALMEPCAVGRMVDLRSQTFPRAGASREHDCAT